MTTPSASGPILWAKEIGGELIVSFANGGIRRTRCAQTEWRDTEQPYPMEVNQVVCCSNIAILSWMDRELAIGFLAAMDMNEEWGEVYASRSDFKHSFYPNRQIESIFHWTHQLTAEIVAMTSHGNQLAFVTYNQGVYMMEPKIEWCDEIWRKEIPDWPKPWANAIWKTPENKNGNVETVVQSIHLDETSLTLFDDRGSWVRLSAENGQEIGNGRLPFNGLNTGTWKGTDVWAIAEDDRMLHFLDDDFSIINSHRVPGPVNHAVYSKEGWFWTGWRHDGSENRINTTKEIGLFVQLNDHVRILSNDGNWHHFEK